MIHLWLLEKTHAEAPRSESVGLGRRVLACPEARTRGTRTTVQSQLVGRELSNKPLLAHFTHEEAEVQTGTSFAALSKVAKTVAEMLINPDPDPPACNTANLVVKPKGSSPEL